ncbi:hypothetical protein CONPUDRAFT_166851 [Coniophora puteana RWD-64-598 SS2]|uniref:Nephrocystin 3-like N-terminal domain-containing protein n=1 Tax=Coniophora puteana (strain RWD-64-598) TaxID=741705 RepID=A0A5M3MK25_CONPW|nr:uncharacterized protein CONPUDRAFT_166851 [Coniophora puteana RWD-64-598 SS2]EIW79015.1 hypothetical protein CONPUDRAFT_166851 [Coniophora puteana RWD-64-598 SS2]
MTVTDDEIWQKLANEIAPGAEYDSNARRPYSQCLPGTRVELLDALETSLTRGNQRFVWLFGGSGSGKSSVAYSIAERLRNTESLATTFFFSRKYFARSNTDRVFLSLAYQIGLLHHRARNCIIKAIRWNPSLLTAEASPLQQKEALVVEPLKELQHVWEGGRTMIFDAADEGEDNRGVQIKDLANELAELLRDPTIPISSVLFTSRPRSYLQNLTRHSDIANLVTIHQIEHFDASHDVELFLRYQFQDIYDIRDISFVHPHPWPSQNVLDTLLHQIKGQFVVASTICNLVRNAIDPADCLNLVANMYEGEVDPIDVDLGNINSIYRYILSGGDPQCQSSDAETLADVVALAEPLPLSDICKLFTRDVGQNLVHLSPIVHIPSAESLGPVQIHHTSLRDYFSQSSLSGDFYVDPAHSHQRLVCRCLKILQRDLKKDICGLCDSSKLHGEIPDFGERVNVAVSGALRYACRYLTYHLARADHTSEIQALVFRFTKKYLLFFLELSSVIGSLHIGVRSLIDAEKVLSSWGKSEDRELALKLLYDAWRLVLKFFEPIRDSALHLYESALPLCPPQTQLLPVYRALCLVSVMAVEEGLGDRWDYHIREFFVNVFATIIMSPNGHRLVTIAAHDIQVWDPVTGAIIASLDSVQAPDRAAFSPDGIILACQYHTGRTCMWFTEPSSFVELIPPQLEADAAVCAFSHDGLLLATAVTCAANYGVTVHIFDRDRDGESWSHRTPLNFPGNGRVQDLVFSCAGLIMIVTQNRAYILDITDNSWSPHAQPDKKWLSPFHWHCFTYNGDATLHVTGGNEVRMARLNTGEDPVPTWRVEGADVMNPPPFVRRLGDAFLLGDYIYTRDRQIFLPSQTGNWHSLGVITEGKRTSIIDLSLLFGWKKSAPRTNKTRRKDGIAFIPICRPDLKQAVIIKAGHEQLATHVAVDGISGWKTITLNGSIFDVPRSHVCVSRNMELFAILDVSGRTVCIRTLKGLKVCDVTPEIDWVKILEPSISLKIDFSPESTYFNLVAHDHLTVWLAATGVIVGTTDTSRFAFSSDDTLLATAGSDGTVRIFSVGNCMVPLRCITNLPKSVTDLPKPVTDIQLAFPGLTYDIDVLTYIEATEDSHGELAFSQYNSKTSNILQTTTQQTPKDSWSKQLLRSPHLKKFILREWSHDLPWIHNVELKLPEDGSPDTTLFEMDTVCSPGSVVDSNTWSDVTIDGGWIRVGSRRICWLPRYYRPRQGSFWVFANRILYKPSSPANVPRIVLRLKGVDIYYYDW